MTHHEIRANLDAYADGELDERIRAEMREHLSGCSSCAEGMARRRMVARAVFRPIPVPPADYFVTRVMARIRESRPDPLFSPAWRWPALALVATALFLIATAPSDDASREMREPSTGSVLLAGGGAMLTSTSAEPMDSLLDLTVEEI